MTIYTILQVLAPFNLHVIKGERTAGLLSNDLSRIVDCNEVHLNYVKCIIVYTHITLALYRLD